MIKEKIAKYERTINVVIYNSFANLLNIDKIRARFKLKM